MKKLALWLLLVSFSCLVSGCGQDAATTPETSANESEDAGDKPMSEDEMMAVPPEDGGGGAVSEAPSEN